MAAEIRLVWWAEAVGEIFEGRGVRRHPVSEALAAAIHRRNLPRAPFDALIETQIAALETQSFTQDEAVVWAESVQGGLARLAALILGAGEMARAATPAGTVWGLHLLSRAGRMRVADRLLRERLALAAETARTLPVKAFPATLPATLVRSSDASELEKRARLAWAALTGRL